MKENVSVKSLALLLFCQVDNKSEGVAEISPLVSYTGEGLEEFSGKTLSYPFSLSEEGRVNGV